VASAEDARYRLGLAEGFLAEAREDLALRRWRSCADNSQLGVENAAKSALALLGPVGRTHDPADLLRQALLNNRFSPPLVPQVTRLSELASQLGWDVHMASDYGDEIGRRTPWEIFDESAADQALHLAEEGVEVARDVVGGFR